MAFFNESFQKTLCGTQGLFTPSSDTTNHVWDMRGTSGKVGVFSVKTNEVLDNSASSQKFYIAASSLRTTDKIGKFAGGYQEANKSKEINPKFVRRIYRVNQKNATHGYVEIGNTSASFMSCSRTFKCGETYYLNLNVKGGSVISALRHNAYSNVPAFVTCCDDNHDATTYVLNNDGALVYMAWANEIHNNPIFDEFIIPAVALRVNSGGTNTWKYYVPTEEDKAKFANVYLGGVTTDVDLISNISFTTSANPDKAGLVIVGAYVETKFGNCTWQVTDRYDIEPVRIYASEVDSEGEPCFNGTCIQRTEGTQGYGYGESAIRRIILDESYHQRFFNSDLRKREIETDGNITTVVDRTAKYDSLYIQHSVPRYDNPSGTFDNDQYLIEVIASNATIDTLVGILTVLVPDVECEVYGGTDSSVSVVSGDNKVTVVVGSTVTKTYVISPNGENDKLSTNASDYLSSDSTKATAVRNSNDGNGEVTFTGVAVTSSPVTITLPGGFKVKVTVTAA